MIIYTGTLTLHAPSSSCLLSFNAPRAAFFTCYTAYSTHLLALPPLLQEPDPERGRRDRRLLRGPRARVRGIHARGGGRGAKGGLSQRPVRRRPFHRLHWALPRPGELKQRRLAPCAFVTSPYLCLRPCMPFYAQVNAIRVRFFSQVRLKQGLYRHPVEDITYMTD